MLTYCLVCKKNTENKDEKMVSSNCAVCGNKKSRFMKEQKPIGLLSNVRIKTPLSKIPLLGDLLF